MKVYMPAADPLTLKLRRERGADRWDEMWEGVLHMTPAPNEEHQRILTKLLIFLDKHCEQGGLGIIRPDINVAPPGGWDENYRIPDISFIATGNAGGFVEGGACFEGAPEVVFEIASRDQEAFEKLPFYARLGVPEVVIIDRDAKTVRVQMLSGEGYLVQRPDAEGWHLLERLGIELRTLRQEGRATLALRARGGEAVTLI